MSVYFKEDKVLFPNQQMFDSIKTHFIVFYKQEMRSHVGRETINEKTHGYLIQRRSDKAFNGYIVNRGLTYFEWRVTSI